MKKKINVGILGSTGSIGTQTLQVISECKTIDYSIDFLTANNNFNLLIQQAIIHKPKSVVIVNKIYAKRIKKQLNGLNISVYSGVSSLEKIVETETTDIVLTALVGFSGLKPTINAIKYGKKIALANKETLVVAGELIMSLCKKKGVPIIPVDSEHSAIFQCLQGEPQEHVDSLILTASGGPFVGKKRDELKNIKVKEALNHPNWKMGAKITIDSASLMNKGLEVIEAMWLFNINVKNIEVVVHTQSIIHSAVRFVDGSIIAQLGHPDMKLPIHYALSFPQRQPSDLKRFDFLEHPNFSFEKPDYKTFKNLSLAFLAAKKGGSAPCVLNAANEIVVQAFLEERISFLKMSDIIENCMEKINFVKEPDLKSLIDIDHETRFLAKSLIK